MTVFAKTGLHKMRILSVQHVILSTNQTKRFIKQDKLPSVDNTARESLLMYKSEMINCETINNDMCLLIKFPNNLANCPFRTKALCIYILCILFMNDKTMYYQSHSGADAL